MTLPDYIIIGAQRCGTTSMMHYIADHPGVGNVPRKEVRFFDWNFNKGIKWYERKLGKREPGKLYGEKSPGCLVAPQAPRRAAEIAPHAKLIVLLRSPVDRAWSQYWLKRHLGREKRPFNVAVWQSPKDHVKNIWSSAVSGYLFRGHYAEQLERWFSYFPREQFCIIKSEDFFQDTKRIMATVWAFLSLPQIHGQYKRMARLSKGQMGNKTKEKLEAYFGPFNQDLYELLGRDMGWDT
jgi:hypothetical protein